jgi:ABC-type nitrate/sulfonate/bicarbonate transport system ATPase subunit
MQEWLLGVWEEFRRTMVFITHDVEEAVFLSDAVYLLTARPARIKQAIRVPFPRPRTHELMTTSEFVKLKRDLLELVWEEGADSLSVDRDTALKGERHDWS